VKLGAFRGVLVESWSNKTAACGPSKIWFSCLGVLLTY